MEPKGPFCRAVASNTPDFCEYTPRDDTALEIRLTVLCLFLTFGVGRNKNKMAANKAVEAFEGDEGNQNPCWKVFTIRNQKHYLEY